MKHLNKIINGDVLKVMKKIPSNSVHLAITSPPYNVGKNYDNHNDELKSSFQSIMILLINLEN